MTQIKLSKSSLSLEKKNLRNYQQFLPSLDLKRRKLHIEKNIAVTNLEVIKKNISEKEQFIAKNFPMLADHEIKLDDLVMIKSIEIKKENIVGVNLPVVNKINFTTKDYDLFNTSHWVDNFISELKTVIELKIRMGIAQQRVELLEKSLQIVTQRTNLFEKVLIPKTVDNIHDIQIFLADNERAAVVRSKIAKKKRQE